MLRPLLIAAVLVVAAVPSPAQEAGSASATDFVRGKSDLILTIVNQAAADDAALAQKREELRAAIRDFLSYDVLSRRTLGDHWDQRTPTEQQEFVGLLRDLIETSYSRKLGTGTVEQEQYLVDYVGERSRRDRTTVEATVTVEGEECLRIDDVTFDADGKFDGGWRPHYRLIDENTVLYCAKQWSMSGKPVEAAPLLTPNHPDWGESQPHPESLLLRPGQVAPPDGDWNGNVVDEGLCKVKIGRRTFECVRRVGGGGVEEFEWSDGPVPDVATEEYFLPDGRLLLWRRYNGMAWSRKNPRRAKSRGAYELLVEAGLPELEVFDQVYRLWYDQIPEYAL